MTPAQQLLRMVPTDGRDEVEAVIANQDVGFVELGQQAEIKIDTFPFTRYGLSGPCAGDRARLGRRAPERSAPPRIPQRERRAGQPRTLPSARLRRADRLAQTSLNVDGKPLDLAPGMAVTAEIKTGKRRVLDYLLSPFHRYSHDVLRER